MHANRLTLLAILATTALLAWSCSKPQPPAPAATKTPPGPEELLVRIDGLDIRFGEVTPYLPVLDTIGPEWSPKVKFRRVLEEFTIPLRLAQRAFPEQRRKLLEQAKALRGVASNYRELEQFGGHLITKRKKLTRRSVELPIAMFLFDEMLMGSVSDPIEVPRGYVVATAHDLQQSAMVIDDLVDCLQVGFLSHTPGDWQSWLENEQGRIANRVEFIHPDYRDYLPQWIQLP